jgi:hypothetical protein
MGNQEGKMEVLFYVVTAMIWGVIVLACFRKVKPETWEQWRDRQW